MPALLTRRTVCFKILIVLLVSLIALNTCAQNIQLKKTDSVLTLVKKYFKTKDADAIYALTGANFKKAITQGAFRDVCFNNLFPLGEIKKDSLLSFVNNKTATYKIQFEAVAMQLLINLDQDDKIELFLFQPFKEEPIDKPALVASFNPEWRDLYETIAL